MRTSAAPSRDQRPRWRVAPGCRPLVLLRARLVLGLTAALAGGCARFAPRPLIPARIADEFQSRSLSDPGLRTFVEAHQAGPPAPWPLPSWDLPDLTLVALYYHPDLDVARAKWAVARAGSQTAGERPNPTLSVSPAYNTTTTIPSPWLVTPSLEIPIETAGKRGYRLAQAAQLSEAARLNIAAVAWQVRSRVRRSLVDLFAAGRIRDVLVEQRAIQIENLRLLELQRQAGAVSAFEVTQARIAGDTTQLALRDIERRQAEAQVQLADALGIPANALEGVRFSFAELENLPGDVPGAEARRQALLSRADILATLAEYAASEAALQLEIAKQYPDVHLSPGYEFDQGDNKWSLGLAVTLPVLNQNRGPIAEAEARRNAAAANFSALQARVLGEIDRALARYRGALAGQHEAGALLTHSLEQERASRASLEAGAISRSELVAQRLQVSAATLAGLEILVAAQHALGDLEDALQSPVSLPVNALSTLTQPRADQPKFVTP